MPLHDLASRSARGRSISRGACFSVLFRRPLIASAVFLAALLALPSACSKKPSTSRTGRSPLLVFAVDGLEWRVMKPLLESGKLPVMSGLMKQGTYGYLSTIQPTLSAAIWTSVATGKVPDQHGILGFVHEEIVGGKKKFGYYTSGHRRAKALWNIATDYNLTTACIGWWMTYPAEPIKGVMVSQTNTAKILEDPQDALWKGSLIKGVEDQVYPSDRQNRVMEILEEVDDSLEAITEGRFGRPRYRLDDFTQLMWNQTQWTFRADETYVRVARDLVDHAGPFDIFMLYIGGTDVAAHRFWRYAHPEQFTHPPDPKQVEDFGHVIDDYYEYADRAIGEIIARVPGATVIVLSDHGMHATNTERVFTVEDAARNSTSGNHLDAPPGIIIASGGPIRTTGATWNGTGVFDLTELPRVGSVLDVLPTMLAIEGIPIGEDMDGTPLRAILDAEKFAAKDIRFVPTHDNPSWVAGQATRMKRAYDETERIEQLRALGYIK